MWRRDRGYSAARVERFYRHVLEARPRRRRVMVLLYLSGLVLGAGVTVVVAPSAAVMAMMVVVGVMAVWEARCGEVLRTGGLRWTHRDRGVIEIELLGGGRTWRRDLREVSVRSLELEWREWRALKVTMVTAVFPVRWLRFWGFEIRDCGREMQLGYRVVYWAKWLEWRLGSVVRGQDRPRLRRRGCVVATHGMGRWMEVVSELPDGLRRRAVRSTTAT